MKNILCLFAASFLFNAPLFAEAPAFTGEAAKIKAYMEDLFDASKKVNLPGTEKAKSRAAIEAAIDWDKIATGALGTANAKKHAGKNFSDFRGLLKDVVTKTAFSRMDKFWQEGTVVTFKSIDVKGGLAHVAATFTVKDESFSLDYYLTKRGAGWAVYDIAYEDLKYSDNINEQIEAFLKEKPFKELLVKLQKRREELDSPKSKKG